jgi:hypothetical protein
MGSGNGNGGEGKTLLKGSGEWLYTVIWGIHIRGKLDNAEKNILFM